MIRTQVILKEGQRQALEKLAKKQGRSVSEVVREMVDEHLRLDRECRLREAALNLRNDYLNDPELTAFSAIDSDVIHEEG